MIPNANAFGHVAWQRAGGIRRGSGYELRPGSRSFGRSVATPIASLCHPARSAAFDVVLMSYISGSVPEAIIAKLYANAYKALKPGGRLLVHDFMVNDSLDGPALGALWALQHVTVNADGLGLCPAEIISRMGDGGFDTSKCETMEMIHNMTKLIVAHK